MKLFGSPGTEYRQSLSEDLPIALAYQRPITPTSRFGGIERGRWYIEPGFGGLGYSSYSGTIVEPGLKTGVRLETKSLGIVDLYVIGSTRTTFGGQR